MLLSLPCLLFNPLCNPARRVSSQSQQDKLQRITRLQTAIASLETYKSFFERQGEIAPEDAWVARYQVRQPQKAYW